VESAEQESKLSSLSAAAQIAFNINAPVFKPKKPVGLPADINSSMQMGVPFGLEVSNENSV
jgi:hypothetical protein